MFIVAIDNVEEFMKTEMFEDFSKQCREYEEACKKDNLEWLENDVQRTVYLDWCSGKSVYNKSYKSDNNVSDKDFKMAECAIGDMISKGLG